MNKQIEALKLALEALEVATTPLAKDRQEVLRARAAIRESLAQPEQKYRRGDRLVCLETDEYCVIHIAGTNRQWVKFPDTHIGVYTNEQVDQLFEKLTKEPDTEQPEQEPVAVTRLEDGYIKIDYLADPFPVGFLYAAPLQSAQPYPDNFIDALKYDVAKRDSEAEQQKLTPYMVHAHGAIQRMASRKPLTDEQRQYIVRMWKGGNWTAGDIIDAVEAAHGIGEKK